MNAAFAALGKLFLFRRLAGFILCFSLLAMAVPARADTDLPVFGPQRYERMQGEPTVYTATFGRCEPSGLALMRVWNGGEKKSRITAAEIFVNGRVIFAEHEFKQQIDYLEKLIPVEEVNELKVVLKSGDFKIPAFLEIDILGKHCDNTPPPPPQLSPLATPTTIAEAAIAGEAEAFALVRILAQPPGATAATLLGVAQADAAGRFTFPDVTLNEGTTIFSATATDAAGNESSPSGEIAILLDTVPPVITVTAPAEPALTEVLAIDIAGSLSEVAALTIDGATVILDGLAFDHSVTLAPGINTFILLATDLAGNTGTASITVHADNTPPTVTVAAPIDGILTRNAVITVAGTVDEEGCVASLNGQPLTVSGMNFSAAHTLQEGENTLTVVAVDRAGNSGEDAVRVILDSQPPQLSLAAPVEGTAGRNLELALEAADPYGLYLLELRAGGMTIWSGTFDGATSATRTVGYTLPPMLPPGTRVELQALAIDRIGNEVTTVAEVLVTRAAAGPGTLQGEVYDDRRGLRLAGATWEILGRAEAGETTAEGGYFAELAAADYLVRLSKPGHTAVDRLVSVRAEQSAAALDARLTPVTGAVKVPVPLAEPLKISIPLAEGSPLELTLAAETLAEEIALRLTPVSNQGLAGLLPSGWSPLAALDIRALHAVNGEILAAPPALSAALLSLPLPEGVDIPVGPGPLLARYDENAHQWIAVTAVTIDADRRRANTFLEGMGQYALVLPDPDPLAPPPAIIGAPLAAAADGAAPDFATVTAVGRVVPPASPPLKELIAMGELVLTAEAAALPSGTVVNARITERFDLSSGESVQPADYVQDLILYRTPCVTNPRRGVAGQTAGAYSLRATFPVSPSREYGFVDLLLGKVGIEFWPGEQNVAEGTMVGSDGARLLTETGDALEIPAGALVRTTPVSLRTAAATAAFAGDDFLPLRTLIVDLAGQTLAAPATLSISTPAGYDPSLPVVLARVIDFGGAQRLKLVGFVQKSGSMLVSETVFSAPSAPAAVKDLALPGVAIGGVYVFLQAKAPVGLVGGQVTAIAGAPSVGARVSTAGATLVDVTGGDGRYLLALPLAPFTVRAVDPLMADRAEGSAQAQSAWQLVPLDLAIQASPPRVVAIEPADGSSGIEPSAPLRVIFSEPVERATVNDQTLVLRDAVGNAIPGVFSFSPDGTVVSFYPAATLKSETAHTLAISAGVRDLQGYSLAPAVMSAFTTRDTTPPPPPAAGAISATFPDAEGMVDITASQGSAEIGCTVLVINDATGEIVAVTPQPNGSFTARIAAQLGDEIQIVLMDAAGNQTLVSYLTFKASDGRYLVTAKGGKVEGEGGSLLEIPEGALVGPAILKITRVAQEELSHPVPEQFQFVGAFKVDTGGLSFTKEVDLSMPLPAGYPAGTFPMVVRPITHVNADGSKEEVFEIIDYAKVENGRLTTASYPYPGILEAGVYIFFYPDLLSELGGPVKVSGITYHDKNGVGGYQLDDDVPVKKAVVRSTRAESLIAYSNAEGRYASFGWSRSTTNRDFTVTAIHPLTMNRVEIPLSVNAEPYEVKNLNFKLADKDTNFPDTTAPDLKVTINVAPSATGGYNYGFIELGTPLVFDIIVIDQEIDRVAISGQFAGDDGVRISVPVSVDLSKQDLYTALDRGEGGESGKAATWKYTYQTLFSGEFNASGGAFNPSRSGLYSFVVEAVDKAKNTTTRTREIQAVAKGEIPGSVAGPPTVVDIHPGDGAFGLPVTSTVSIYFNEPVLNVTSETLRLIDLQSKQPVPAYVYTGIDDGIMRATIQPKSNLYFGRDYQVVVTTAITDRPDSNPPDETGEVKSLPLREERRTTFRTKEPKLYGLPDEQGLNGTRDIAFYRFGSNTYAAVAAGVNGWQVLDVTDPTRSRIIDAHNLTNAGVSWEVRGVAVDQQSGILAVTENIRFADGVHYGYLRLFSLRKIVDKTADAKVPIGKAKLAEGYSGVPTRLAIRNGKAYVATTGAGLQIVDLAAAQKTGSEAGNPIVGAFTSEAEGYGMVLDIVLGSGNQILLTTQSGQLLILDVNIPQMPRILSATNFGGGIMQAAVALDYRFTVDGAIEYRDMAVVSCRDGNIRTLDISNPTAPVLMGEAVDGTGKPLSFSVRDLTISPGSGVAVASTFNTLEIIDIRDPYQPRLLLRLAQDPQNSSRLAALGTLDGVEILNGWLYACSTNDGLRIIDLDTVTIVAEPRYIVLDAAGRPVDPKNTSQALPALKYTIAPSDYQAATAEVVIYKDGQLIAALPGARQAGGSVDITKTAAGVPITYDPASVYYAQVVLNRSAGLPIEGPKIPFIRQAVLIPDYNRDRKIDEQDRQLAMEGKTFYFWINDDDDEGETKGSDIPGSKMSWTETTENGITHDEIHNYENTVVDGVRDLVDFFPVQLDLKDLLKLYPVEEYSYSLTTGGEHLNFVFTKFTGAQAGNYLVGDPQSQVDGHNDLAEAKILGNVFTNAIASGGSGLFSSVGGEPFLTRLKTDDRNVILLEGRKPLDGPLALEISDGINRPLRFELNLSIVPVEQMFRHVNLIDEATKGYTPPLSGTKWGEPNRVMSQQFEDLFGKKAREHLEGFDSTLDDENFVFVHGYNVNGQQARGWQSEMFKRLYWSGSKSKFWGITWYGSDTQIADLFTVNFHKNINHAIETAGALKDILNLMYGEIFLAAHSLGNMVVSSCLNDHKPFTNIRGFLLVDAAVAQEAYLGSSAEDILSSSNPMIHPDWYGYKKELGASEWHTLFDDNNADTITDHREMLTWRNRFDNLSKLQIKLYNFYSKGEEVLDTHTGDPGILDLFTDGMGRYSWALQEKLKGRLPVLGYIGGGRYGGWGKNVEDYYDEATYSATKQKKPLISILANKIALTEIKNIPFFNKDFDSALFSDTGGSNYAQKHRDKLLAETFPALSLPVGGNAGAAMEEFVPGETEVFDMQSQFQNGWPEERIEKGDKGWKHSDLKNVSYLYIYMIFEKIVNLMGVKQ